MLTTVTPTLSIKNGKTKSVKVAVPLPADLAPGTVWAPATAPGLAVRSLVGPAGSPVTLAGSRPGSTDGSGSTDGGVA